MHVSDAIQCLNENQVHLHNIAGIEKDFCMEGGACGHSTLVLLITNAPSLGFLLPFFFARHAAITEQNWRGGGGMRELSIPAYCMEQRSATTGQPLLLNEKGNV